MKTNSLSYRELTHIIQRFGERLFGRSRGRLLRHYFVMSVVLIGGGLLTGGLLEIYFRYQENYQDLSLLQQEVANGAAFKTARFFQEIENTMRAATKSSDVTRHGLSQNLTEELNRVLLAAPAIEDLRVLDRAGRVRLRASRFEEAPVQDNDEAVAPQAVFEALADGDAYFSPVTFVRDSEPYNSVAIPIERYPGQTIGVLWAKVALKYIWDVIQDVKIGNAGYAYIVTRSGDLVAHPDLSLVLRRVNLGALKQVRAAFYSSSTSPTERSLTAQNFQGRDVFVSYALIPNLDWALLVERPLEDAYAPIYASMMRTSVLLLLALGIALLAGMIVARRVVQPLEALRAGVDRIGKGNLDFRLRIKTGNELETLAEAFNNMTGALQGAYTGLENKVAQRTRELNEMLGRQTATAEVLRAMARSPTDLQVVLDAVILNAVTLAHADAGVIRLYDDAMRFRIVAYHRNQGSKVHDIQNIPLRPDEDSGSTRAIRERKAVHILDIHNEGPMFRGPIEQGLARTVLAVPMLRQNQAIGVIVIFRDTVAAFTDRQIEMVTTFADQAVIAIENVRLFQELETRTRELARSVEELKTLGEVSQGVSSSLDLQTVLKTIVFHAARLSQADAGGVCEYKAETGEYVIQATYQLSDELVNAIQKSRVPLGDSVLGKTVSKREAVQIPDILATPDYPLRDIVQRMGARAILGVPLIREGAVIGALLVARNTPGSFREETIELLKTFAAQSAVAIQNARLFREIETANVQLQELDRLKSDFLSNVSHELRTPLTAIEALIDNMLDGLTGTLNHKQVHYVSGIRESTDRLARLIDDLLDISAIEAGRSELKITPFALDRMIREVTDTLRPMASKKSITLEVAFGGDQFAAWGDRDKFIQVLTNLISNAIKFTPVGGRIDIDVDTNGYEWAKVTVSDNGPGISSEEAKRIFDEFYQARSAREGKSKGVGLGLAISRKLVEMHGGKIWVESVMGAGSTFAFTVPGKPPSRPSASLN